MKDFPEWEWWQAYQDELNSDENWTRAARFFPARIELRHEQGSVTLDTLDGRVVGIGEGPHPMGSDIVVAAPDREWRRLLAGGKDWFQGKWPGLRQVAIEGRSGEDKAEIQLR